MKKYARIQLYIAGTFLILSLLMFLIIYIIAARSIKERQVSMLELELETTEMEVQLFFDEFVYVLEDVSTFINLNQTTGLKDYITAKNNHHDNIASIYYGTIDNVMYNSSNFIPPIGFDLRTRPWYQLSVEKNATVVTPAFLNATQDYLIATIAKPYYDNDVLQGVIGVDVRINNINTHIKTRSIGQTGYAILIDSNNKIITMPDHWQLENSLNDASLLQIDFDEMNENQVYERKSFYQDKGSLIFTDVVLDFYTLVIFIPEAEFYRTQVQFRNFFIVTFILIDIIGITFILFNRMFIIKPLQRLDDQIALIDIKKNRHYRISYHMNDHFLDIKKTLNKTLDAAEDFINESHAASDALHLEYQRFKLLIDSTQDFIIQINENHRIVSAYGKGLTKLGLIEEDMVGKTMNEVFSEDKIFHDEVLNEALLGKNKLYDWDINLNNSQYIYETSVSPIYNQNNDIIGVVSISRDITEASIKQAEIKYINQHDYLTGLYNRRTFQERFDELVSSNQHPIILMMLDLNGLKLINDAFGHIKGDVALTKVSSVLKQELEDHFVARIGGDEFAAILTNLSQKEVEKLNDQIIRKVSMQVVENIHLSISIGYEVVDRLNIDFNEVMKKAENNMYRHKITESMSVRNNAIKAIHKTLTDKYRDERIHSEKVSQLCYVIGLALELNVDSLKELKLAGMYHDIGKIAIPDAILNKPDMLTEAEFEIMKTHTETGYNILRAADEYSKLAEYALSHHERWDGKGYPRGLKSGDIPYFARIINLADSFDAMTSIRPYKDKMTKDRAVQEIIKHAGKQFDPDLAKVFVEKVLKRQWIDKKGE